METELAEGAAAPANEAPAKVEPTPRDAIDRAFKAIDEEEARAPRPVESQPQADEADDEPAKTEKTEKKAEKPAREPKDAKADDEVKAKPEAKEDDRERDETGRFKAKEGDAPKAEDKPNPASDAPARFSPDAKAAWAEAPDAVKSETTRALKEMEAGLQRYQAEFGELKDYAALAKQHGTSLRQALDNYTNLERTLASDPVRGLQMVADYAGINLREFAARLAGQSPDQTQVDNENTIRGLRQEIAALKQEFGGVRNTIAEQREASVMQQVQAFANEHPRMNDEAFSQDVAFFITSGRTSDLAEAYRLAERLNPAPVQIETPPSRPVSTPQHPDLSAQTRKGSLSLSGAPSSGSNPANRKPPSSPREAVDRAFASLGI